jgi:hypothetical protein
MPNWCYNFAEIKCPDKEIYNKLIYSITNKCWFTTFAPLNIDIESENENEFDYNLAKDLWKTKWNPDDIEIVNKDENLYTIIIAFETAWTPPTGVYSIMNKKYNIETIAYYEELGCEFFGECIFSNDEEIDETYDIPSNKEELNEIRNIIGRELDEFMSSIWEQLEEQWQQEKDDEVDDDNDSA